MLIFEPALVFTGIRLGNFDSSVFNEYENANLQLLVQLDTYK